MGHLPKLIEDLALILITGAITTLIFKKIKQPLVLGYIIAGFVVGPYFSLTPTVVDAANVKTLAEMGVIFLLFTLGLEFSFKKLARVGGSATITAFVEIIFITIAGYFAGVWMGWSRMDALFLGGMLASSSTTIIIKAFDELGIKTKAYARIVFGVLIVEDIVVILMMVLLSTMAVSQQVEGTELLLTVLKLLFFLALWFIMGIYLLPTFLKKTKKLMDEENLLILSLGLCLGMVVLATQVGFSAELGAFIMGSIMAETTSAEKIEHLIKPVKDLFGAIFFISVGMMIDPAAMVAYKWPILIVTGITLFGKLFSTTLGAVLSGQPLKQSVQVGMSMAQIGEFAFIVAALGLSLGVISDFLFPVAVGASAITTFTTPYLIRYSEPFYNWLSRAMPPRLLHVIESYSHNTGNAGSESRWKKVLMAHLKTIVVNGVVLLALSLLFFQFLAPFFARQFEAPFTAAIVSLVILLVVSAPFLWAIMAKRPEHLPYKEMWLERKYNKGPLLALEAFRYLLGVFYVGLCVDRLISARVAILFVVPVAIGVLWIFSRKIQRFYLRLESRFIKNLNARETAEQKKLAQSHEMERNGNGLEHKLAPYAAHIISHEVHPMADYVGKTLMELAWREQYGINIAFIRRGDMLIHAPGRNNRLLPYDHIGIIATDEQMQAFSAVLEKREVTNGAPPAIEDIVLQKIPVRHMDEVSGQTIRNSGIREKTNGLVIGIERGNVRILNPDSGIVLEKDDVLMIVGEKEKLKGVIVKD